MTVKGGSVHFIPSLIAKKLKTNVEIEQYRTEKMEIEQFGTHNILICFHGFAQCKYILIFAKLTKLKYDSIEHSMHYHFLIRC